MSRSSPVVLTAATLLTLATPWVAFADDSLSSEPQPEFTHVTSVDGTIVDAAAGNPNFSALVGALQAAGLAETLKGAGPFTVFAPTNEAFAKIPQSALNSLVASPDSLKALLLYHVTEGVKDIRYQYSPHNITTVQGQTVYADRACAPTNEPASGGQTDQCSAGEELRINNSKVQGKVIRTSNGVIYVIDSVLLPQLR
jgi:uncharacterized surface protein with fasciclin (FAS1) repeats